jgi:hypothetical protein
MKSIPVLFLLMAACPPAAAQSPPPLMISLPSASVTRLAWPLSAADWNLTTSTSLAGSWAPVASVPQNEGSELAVLLPVADTRRFYRLEKRCIFMATPPAIQPGGTSLLTWCPLPGFSYQLYPGPGPVNGSSFSVSPAQTTTYTLLAIDGKNITPAYATVTVGNGGNTCPFANVSTWTGTLEFSYGRSPSSADWSFNISQEAHLGFQLTRRMVTPLSAEFSGYVTGNARINDRAEETGQPPQIRTLVGNGAPVTSAKDDRVSLFTLFIDCTSNTYTFVVAPVIDAAGTGPDGTVVNGPWGVGKVDIRQRPLPAMVGTLSSSEFLPARGPTWTGTTDHYHPGGFGDVMFVTGTVNDESAGSASANWSLTPVP